jgi:hypothetical protein
LPNILQILMQSKVTMFHMLIFVLVRVNYISADLGYYPNSSWYKDDDSASNDEIRYSDSNPAPIFPVYLEILKACRKKMKA